MTATFVSRATGDKPKKKKKEGGEGTQRPLRYSRGTVDPKQPYTVTIYSTYSLNKCDGLFEADWKRKFTKESKEKAIDCGL